MSFGVQTEYGFRDKVRVRNAGVGHIVKCDSMMRVLIYTIRVTDPEGTGKAIDERITCVPADMELVEKAPQEIE